MTVDNAINLSDVWTSALSDRKDEWFPTLEVYSRASGCAIDKSRGYALAANWFMEDDQLSEDESDRRETNPLPPSECVGLAHITSF